MASLSGIEEQANNDSRSISHTHSENLNLLMGLSAGLSDTNDRTVFHDEETYHDYKYNKEISNETLNWKSD